MPKTSSARIARTPPPALAGTAAALRDGSGTPDTALATASETAAATEVTAGTASSARKREAAERGGVPLPAGRTP